MAFWAKQLKPEAISPLEFAKAIVKAELLQEANDKLHKQIDRLQEALVAATAPKAYESMMRDKDEGLALQPTAEQLKKQEEKAEEEAFLKDYVDGMEKPTFADADDMISALSRIVGVAVAEEPVHANNQES
jgi:predicted metal-dependent phosphoesterase TrpH